MEKTTVIQMIKNLTSKNKSFIYLIVQGLDFIESIDAENISNFYIMQRSGQKYLGAPFDNYQVLFDTNDMNVINEGISKFTLSTFYDKWKRIYNALVGTQYEILNSYKTKEVRTPNITKKDTSNTTDDNTQKEDTNLKTSNEGLNQDSIYGFNSEEPVNNNESSKTSSVNVTGTGENNKIQTHTERTSSKTNVESGDETTIIEGNKGENSYQKLIEQELKLRQKDFWSIVFSDIDNLLLLKIY